jgi:hypothetical protein
MRNYAIATLALLVLACATWARYTLGQLAESRANEQALALRASNVEALHDTTHDLALENLQFARLVGHSNHAYEKRVVQEVQEPDRLDSLLGKQHSGIYAMRVGIDSVQATVARATGDSIDQGAMPFHLRQQPFTLDAVVSRQPGGDSTSIAVRIALDTIPLGVRIECSPPGDAGIRAASVLATAPPWATVRFGDVQQNPDVCNSAPPPITRPRFVSWKPLALSAGWQLGAGRGGWTALIGTALTFGAP